MLRFLCRYYRWKKNRFVGRNNNEQSDEDDQRINETSARLTKRFEIARRRIFSASRCCWLLGRIKKFDLRRHSRTIIHPFSRRRHKMHCVSFYCWFGQELGHVHTYTQFAAALGVHFESHRIRLMRQSRCWLFIVVSWRSLIFFDHTRATIAIPFLARSNIYC